MSNPTLAHGILFTVQEYRYTTFEFGTDKGYHAKYGGTTDSDAVWAFPHAAVLSDTPIARDPISGPHLSFGDLVDVPGHGTYRIEREHNRNVKFIKEYAS